MGKCDAYEIVIGCASQRQQHEARSHRRGASRHAKKQPGSRHSASKYNGRHRTRLDKVGTAQGTKQHSERHHNAHKSLEFASQRKGFTRHRENAIVEEPDLISL